MLLCCRLRSRKLNQRNPQTLLLLLHMVVILGDVAMVIVMVVSAAHIAVLAVVVLALPLIGQWDQDLVVGLVIMVDMVVGVSLVAVMEITLVVNLVIEKRHLATLADLVLMAEVLVGGIAVGWVLMVVEGVMEVMVELGQVVDMTLALVLVMVEQEGEFMEVEQVIVAVVGTILIQDRCPLSIL